MRAGNPSNIEKTAAVAAGAVKDAPSSGRTGKRKVEPRQLRVGQTSNPLSEARETLPKQSSMSCSQESRSPINQGFLKKTSKLRSQRAISYVPKLDFPRVPAPATPSKVAGRHLRRRSKGGSAGAKGFACFTRRQTWTAQRGIRRGSGVV